MRNRIKRIRRMCAIAALVAAPAAGLAVADGTRTVLASGCWATANGSSTYGQCNDGAAGSMRAVQYCVWGGGWQYGPWVSHFSISTTPQCFTGASNRGVQVTF